MLAARRTAVYGVVWALVLCGGVAAAAQEVTPEYQVKAAFVSKFLEFTEWPAGVIESRKTVDICVVRPNPFADILGQLVAGESFRGRPLRVREVSAIADVRECVVLFVPQQQKGRELTLLKSARELPILTVGESPQFLDDGGIINLHLVEGRVRFDISVETARRVGIRLRAQLLRLALNVRGESP